VEADGRGDAGMCYDEIADGLGFGLRERRRAAVRIARGEGARALAPPAIAVIAIEVHAVAVIRIGLPVLAPVAVVAGLDVVFAAVRVDVGQDPDLALLDEVGQRGIDAIAFGEQADDRQRHFDGQVFARVVERHKEDGRFIRLVAFGIVADLDRGEGPTLHAHTGIGQAHDVRVGGGGICQGRQKFGIVVVGCVRRRKVERRDGQRAEAGLARGRQLGGGHHADRVLPAQAIDGKTLLREGRALDRVCGGQHDGVEAGCRRRVLCGFSLERDRAARRHQESKQDRKEQPAQTVDRHRGSFLQTSWAEQQSLSLRSRRKPALVLP